MRRPQKVFWMILCAAFFLGLNFWLRSWVVSLEGFTTACNSDWPLGIPLPKWFTLIGLGIGIFLVTQWGKENSLSQEWPWILIISGGASNLLERALFGCIMDYVALPYFPVFNFADVLLTIGVAGILISTKSKITISK